jgi:mevalonate kinase
MAETTASAPGKVILCGEHAVVYGFPAIAAPVTQVRATATVCDATGRGVRLLAPDIGRDVWLASARNNDALAAAVRVVQQHAGLAELPPLEIRVHSTIPIASGLGSGAATAAAVIRALTAHLGRLDLSSDGAVCDLTYIVEQIHHGTPSGIDNTVVAYEQPVYFVRQRPQNRIEPLVVGRPAHLLVGDTGLRSATHAVVGDVRRQWQAEPRRFETMFAACGKIAEEARVVLETGELHRLGALLNENHRWLQEMTVSDPALDQLVSAARDAGALGAKLSGAGRGGNMIALVDPAQLNAVRQALEAAGAAQVLASILE